MGLVLLSKHEAVCSAWCMHRAVQGLAEWRLSLTLAGSPIGHHSVALLWACTLVAPGHIDTAEGAENASALCTLVDVCQKGSAGEPQPAIHQHSWDSQGPVYKGRQEGSKWWV